MAKAYEQLGLTKEEVKEMQYWLFSMIEETKSVSDMITKTVNYFSGTTILHYALYLLGNEIGQASVKEQIGLTHVLNPENS